MTESFDPTAGLVVVLARIKGPLGEATIVVAIDTGATSTLISREVLDEIGCTPNADAERTMITTGSGVEFVGTVKLSELKTLGQETHDVAVLSHTLPPTASVDGLIGLDFMRGRLGRVRVA